MSRFNEGYLGSSIMFTIECLHPDGWRKQGQSTLEYWANQEARVRCCSDGRHYRVIEEATGAVMSWVDSSCCQQAAARLVCGADQGCSQVSPH